MIQENIQVIPRRQSFVSRFRIFVDTETCLKDTVVQSFQIGGKIPLELAMTFLPGNCSRFPSALARSWLKMELQTGVILAIGCTENRIPIYSASVKDNIVSSCSRIDASLTTR